MQQQEVSSPISNSPSQLSRQNSTDNIPKLHVNSQVENSDDVVITNIKSSAPAHPKYHVNSDGSLPEHSYKSTYKLKAMSLLKLFPGRGWAKVYETPELFLSKVVQTVDEVAYIIGGAKDKQSQQTVRDVVAIRLLGNQKIERCDKAPMISSRSSFGCVINVTRNEIYVAGGYIDGQITRKCEVYSIKDN